MKRTFTRMAKNWLRKPENQAKIKRTARSLWDRFQNRTDSGSTDHRSPSSPRRPHDPADTTQSESPRRKQPAHDSRTREHR